MFVASTVTQNGWKVFYIEALYEADHNHLPDRICAAQRQIELRARELFNLPGDNIEE